MTSWLFIPFVGHFALVVMLYVALSVLRLRNVMSGSSRYDDYLRPDGDSGAVLRIQRNLSNQFEAPMFAYIAMLVIAMNHATTTWDLWAAWIFLAGRLVHSAVQTLTANVRLRGAVFAINFIGIMMLVAHVAWLAATGALK